MGNTGDGREFNTTDAIDEEEVPPRMGLKFKMSTQNSCDTLCAVKTL